MGDYQLRSFTGWHQHMTLVILAHFFLVRLKLRLKDKAPKLSLAQALRLLKASLPQPDFSLEKTIDIVNYYQERHEAAYQSRRKKRSAQKARAMMSRCSFNGLVNKFFINQLKLSNHYRS